ncbi:hypothetical protein ERJ75_001433200 [Trypanosoma vivax]|uniref:Uncharacterized protein n=1 Tax=Trypanosoma vivax (strain Y486) TaxID=1055687 RepID=G0TTK6_TRYVY|nr:hypothetical protein TRVL_03573 [Trypanosoma vivax]KAH8607164.1 hypothetical protein ERJ75_001433200 [Trypanosoma vivax]CCC47287.1 conserved hypothetical protein [Trypanosoma vivax Y486]
MNDETKKLNAAAVQRLFARGRRTASSTGTWAATTRRDDGTLTTDMHLSNQLQLAHEMGFPLETAKKEAAPSCFELRRQRTRHHYEIPAVEKQKLQGQPPDHILEREQLAARRRERAILRYELTIPRRRVLGHLSHPTQAQSDLSLSVPTQSAAETLVAQAQGRWILQNAHRQQLMHGEPMMTRIMRGEFYTPPRNTRRGKSLCGVNRRRIQTSSDAKVTMHVRNK